MIGAAALLLFAAASGSGPAIVTAQGATLALTAGSGAASKPGQAAGAGATLPLTGGTGAATGGSSYVPVKPNIVTPGSSSTAIGSDSSSFQARVEALTTGPAITNIGAGGTNAAQIRAAWEAQSSTVRAYVPHVQMGGNGMNAPGTVQTAFADHRAIIDGAAALGQTKWLAGPKFNDAGMGWGGAENVYHLKLKRLHRLNNPARLTDWAEIVRNFPGLTGQDVIDQAANVLPTSWRIDASHANQLGKNPYGDELVRWIEGDFNAGGLPHVPAYVRVHGTGVASRAPGGRIGAVPFLTIDGSLSGVTVSSGNASISAALEGSEIVLRNNTAGPLLFGRYAVPLTITRSGRSRVVTIFAYPGSATTAPSTVEYDGQFWFSDPEPLAGFAAGPGLTIAFDPTHAAGTDASEMYPVYLSGGAVATLRRTAGNVYRFQLQDAGGATAFTLNTPVHTVASGRKRYVFTASATLGTACAVIDGVPQTPVSFAPFATFNLNPATWAQSSLFANSAAGANAFRGRKSQLGIWLSYFDPASADALFYNGDGTAKDLGATGAVGGFVPPLLLRGSAGDEYADAANASSTGSPLFAQPKGAATTISMGELAAAPAGVGATLPLTAGTGAAVRTGTVIATGAGASLPLSAAAGQASRIRTVVASGNGTALAISGGFGAATALAPDLRVPVTLAEAKAWLKVETSDDDMLIGTLIDAFAAYAEQQHGIVCGARTHIFTFSGFANRLELLRGPVRAVTGIAYDDTAGAAQALVAGDWALTTRNGVPVLRAAVGASWPVADADTIEVAADIGYATNADVPAAIKLAALEYVALAYQNREGTADTARIDAMLRPYRVTVL